MDKRLGIVMAVGVSLTLAIVLIVVMGVLLMKLLKPQSEPSWPAVTATQPALSPQEPAGMQPGYSTPVSWPQTPTRPPAAPGYQQAEPHWSRNAAPSRRAPDAAPRNQGTGRNQQRRRKPSQAQPRPQEPPRQPPPPPNAPPPLLHQANLPNTAWRVEMPAYGAARIDLQPGNRLHAQLEGMPIETTGAWRVDGNKLHISAEAPPAAAAFGVTGTQNVTCEIRGDQVFYKGVAITRLP